MPASRLVSSRELAGRRAAVGFSDVAIGITRAEGPPAAAEAARIAVANSGPIGVAATGDVKDTPQFGRRGPIEQVPRDGDDPVGEIERIGRRAQLVADHGNSRALARKREHRACKIASERTIDPTGAKNDVVAGGGGNGVFALELAVAINAKRICRIVLAIGAVKAAVEHIIGRKLDDGNSEPGRRARGGFRAQGIDPIGEIGFAFGAIDRRVGGGVDDDVGPKIDQGPFDFRRAGEINVRARNGVKPRRSTPPPVQAAIAQPDHGGPLQRFA